MWEGGCGSRGGTERARPVSKLLPSPHPSSPPQALPRRKIQLVSSNCFAEEPEKEVMREGGPPGGWGVCWETRERGRGRPTACLCLRVSAVSPAQ